MRSQSTSFDVFLASSVAVLAFLLLGPVLTIPLHIPLNYNEGWNALFDTRAVVPATGPLYPSEGSFVFNNYPPLGFCVVGALGHFVFGDMIVAGRVVALISLLGAAMLIGLCVQLLGGSRRAAMAAGLFLLLNMATFFRVYVAMDDPQWLAHAIMLCGLAVLLRACGPGASAGGWPPGLAVAAAALLMVAGGFVKHNLVALPLATTVWLAVFDRRAAMIWLVAALLGILLGLAAAALLYGSIAFEDVLGHRRIVHAALWTQSIGCLAPLAPMALLTWMLMRRRQIGCSHRGAPTMFVLLFATIATITGVVQRCGEGVNYNAHFDTVIAVCLGFGVALSPVLTRPLMVRGRPVGAWFLAVVAALPLVGAWPWHLPTAWHDIHDRASRAAAWKPVIDRIAAADGPAGCILMSLCWWAGKPSQVDVFNLTQSVVAGGPSAGFEAAVAGRRFAIFEDDPASSTHLDAKRRLGRDPIMDAFVGRYAPVAAGPGGGVLLLLPTPGVRPP